MMIFVRIWVCENRTGQTKKLLRDLHTFVVKSLMLVMMFKTKLDLKVQSLGKVQTMLCLEDMHLRVWITDLRRTEEDY